MILWSGCAKLGIFSWSAICWLFDGLGRFTDSVCYRFYLWYGRRTAEVNQSRLLLKRRQVELEVCKALWNLPAFGEFTEEDQRLIDEDWFWGKIPKDSS